MNRNLKLLTRAHLRLQHRASSSQSASVGYALNPADVQIKSKRSFEELPSLSSMSDKARCELAYGLSQSSSAPFSGLKLTNLQREQLNAMDQRTTSSVDSAPLPRSLEDALRPSRRAIVVTETTAPYEVVSVNDAWVDLCGYSYVESKGKSLAELIQGPETDASATTALMHHLLHGEEVGTTLKNYTKSGRVFQNRLRVGPILDGDRVTHFVGVLQEV